MELSAYILTPLTLWDKIPSSNIRGDFTGFLLAQSRRSIHPKRSRVRLTRPDSLAWILSRP
jgi:hypothetical protein